ncbi:hypothetical protein GSI_13220 [Ganoderma sinense ZZ0214-1]|uniref:Uncharacterized protein n=1 Tax=Ganoderma sinense ZZ0214-1 TaxID=1077348 RepID=A0A2G8RUZ4_9APHY|nr:hypothetical protein GSI_13220 [Ganoderma sinense ZZ0214-1]
MVGSYASSSPQSPRFANLLSWKGSTARPLSLLLLDLVLRAHRGELKHHYYAASTVCRLLTALTLTSQHVVLTTPPTPGARSLSGPGRAAGACRPWQIRPTPLVTCSLRPSHSTLREIAKSSPRSATRLGVSGKRRRSSRRCGSTRE